jgi:hypothetical protein
MRLAERWHANCQLVHIPGRGSGRVEGYVIHEPDLDVPFHVEDSVTVRLLNDGRRIVRSVYECRPLGLRPAPSDTTKEGSDA